MLNSVSTKFKNRITTIIHRSTTNIRWLKDGDYTDTDSLWIPNTKTGWLPRIPPTFDLPSEFDVVVSLLDRMQKYQKDGSEGLLEKGTFGETMLKELPMIDVSKYNTTPMLEAIFREYTHLASAYLLEPADLEYRKSVTHGLGRDVLPKNVAVPLSIVAKKLKINPYLNYNSHVLYDWVLIDPNGPIVSENIHCPRNFDGSPGEVWFKAIHVEMTSHSQPLVSLIDNIFESLDQNDRKRFDQCLLEISVTMEKMNASIKRMWKGLNPMKFKNFRNFYMGSNTKAIFPKGVLYEGVSNERTAYPKTSGAADVVQRTLDYLLGITDLIPKMPDLDFLEGMRQSKPQTLVELSEWVRQTAKDKNLIQYALKDNHSKYCYLLCLVRSIELRETHWNMVKGYIFLAEKSSATIGFETVTWIGLPLRSLIARYKEIEKDLKVSDLSAEEKQVYDKMKRKVEQVQKTIEREVKEGARIEATTESVS